jgi:hypothetical protein
MADLELGCQVEIPGTRLVTINQMFDLVSC